MEYHVNQINMNEPDKKFYFGDKEIRLRQAEAEHAKIGCHRPARSLTAIMCTATNDLTAPQPYPSLLKGDNVAETLRDDYEDDINKFFVAKAYARGGLSFYLLCDNCPTNTLKLCDISYFAAIS